MYEREDEIEVRGYELDSFGHLNNAVYLNYLEVARWNFCRECKLIPSEEIGFKDDHFIVVASMSIKYIREIRLYDTVVIKSQYTCDDLYMYSKHVMYSKKTGKKVATAQTKLVYINTERMVCNIPEHVAKILR